MLHQELRNLNTYSGTVIVRTNSSNQHSADIELGNPLENLMFCEDGPTKTYYGTQTGNTLTITGFLWAGDDIVGMPEIAFANVPEQIVGESISINQPIFVTQNKARIVKIAKIYLPYECDQSLEYKGVARDFESHLRSDLEKGVKYPITLSWYDFTATYYVIFNIDPNIIKENSQYLP